MRLCLVPQPPPSRPPTHCTPRMRSPRAGRHHPYRPGCPLSGGRGRPPARGEWRSRPRDCPRGRPTRVKGEPQGGAAAAVAAAAAVTAAARGCVCARAVQQRRPPSPPRPVRGTRGAGGPPQREAQPAAGVPAWAAPAAAGWTQGRRHRRPRRRSRHRHRHRPRHRHLHQVRLRRCRRKQTTFARAWSCGTPEET